MNILINIFIISTIIYVFSFAMVVGGVIATKTQDVNRIRHTFYTDPNHPQTVEWDIKKDVVRFFPKNEDKLKKDQLNNEE